MAFTLGLAQCTHPLDGDALALAYSLAAEAAEAEVDLLILPESFMTRYEEEVGSLLAAAQPLEGPFCTAMNKLAAKTGIWLAYTVNELNSCGNPFNTVVLADNYGKVHSVYRKAHLFDSAATRESERMAAGDAAPAVAETPFGRICIAICYDLRFPELARNAAAQGCDLIAYTSAWVDGPSKVAQWDTLLRARAIENQCFCAGLSRCDAGYIGNSRIYGPLGELVAAADTNSCLLTAAIDLSARTRAAELLPVLDHRRRDIGWAL